MTTQDYRWADQSFKTKAALLDAIAEQWVEADGVASGTEVRQALDAHSDGDLARSCVEAWHLARTDDDPRRYPLESWNADEADLATAFGRYRERAAASS